LVPKGTPDLSIQNNLVERGKLIHHLGKKIISVLAFLAIVIGGIVIALLIVSNMKDLSFVKILAYFFKSTLTSPSGVLNTLSKTTPLLIVSLGLVVAFKTSVWNIGAEGQMAFGIIAALGATLFLNVPSLVRIILAIVFGFIGGGLWAGLAGVLKATWKVPEIPITLMQNFIADAFMLYLISGPWMTSAAGYARTDFIPEGARFPFLARPLNTTFVLSLAIVPIVYWLMNRSELGYKLSATGQNASAAAVAGLKPGKMIIVAMVISGGICGIAGVSLVLGEYFFGVKGLTSQYGFYAIVCVLIAELRVGVIPFTAFFVAFVLMGSTAITNVGVPGPFVHLTMGILFISALMRIVLKKVI
jgi:simple sugar transport system permease protein